MEILLKVFTFHFHTDERENFLCNFSCLISVQNSDVELFHDYDDDDDDDVAN